MSDLTYDTAASLVTEGHIYCVGTLAQCLRRWERLPTEQKPQVFLKMGRDGEPATFLRGEEIDEVIARPELVHYRWR